MKANLDGLIFLVWSVNPLLLILIFNDEYKTYHIYEEAFLNREGHLVFCLLHNMQSLPQKREAFLVRGHSCMDFTPIIRYH